MYLKQDHTYSCVDLFKTYNVDKLKGNGKIARKYKCRDKRALAQKVFLRYLYLLFEDITDGNKIFYFSSKKLSAIRMARVTGEQFKELRKKGFFRDVDFLMSNFSGYFMAMDYYNLRGTRITKNIMLSANFRDKITKKTNEGFKYC